jgi:hypothetical protein
MFRPNLYHHEQTAPNELRHKLPFWKRVARSIKIFPRIEKSPDTPVSTSSLQDPEFDKTKKADEIEKVVEVWFAGSHTGTYA